MQQVAKSLIDTDKNQSIALPQFHIESLGIKCLDALLTWRCASLTRDVATEVKQTGTSFESNLDVIVQLGWASVDSSSFKIFSDELETAPDELRYDLERLCVLYGLSRVEAGLTTYLQYGVLPGKAVGLIRKQINHLCNYFASTDAKTARILCDGFGIPDHLLQAPIAVDNWHRIGA